MKQRYIFLIVFILLILEISLSEIKAKYPLVNLTFISVYVILSVVAVFTIKIEPFYEKEDDKWIKN